MIRREDIDDVYPLTALQEGMLYHALYEPEGRAYFQQMRLELDGPLDPRLCEQTFDALVKRHSALRTAFAHKGAKRPMQVVLKSRKAGFSHLDLSHVSEDALEAEVSQILQRDRLASFDLESDPLLRITLIDRGGDSWTLVMSFHHIIMDGWCTAVIEREFHHLYASSLSGEPALLPPPVRFGDYVKHLESLDKGESNRFWKDTLEGCAEPEPLPFMLKGTSDKSYAHASSSATLDKGTTDRLRDLAKRSGLTLGSLVMALWSAVLMRFHQRIDVVFGQTVSTRPPHIPKIEDAVGLYINTLPARFHGRLDESLLEIATRFQATSVRSAPHRYVSLADVQALADVGAGLIDHVVVFENLPGAGKEQKDELAPGVRAKSASMFEQTNYPLELTVFPGDELRFRFNHDANLFAEGAFERVGRCLLDLARRFAKSPHQSMEELLACSSSERRELLRWGNVTGEAPSPPPLCLVDAWQRAVSRNPNKTALVCEDRFLTYEQADRFARRMACGLAEMGARPGRRVGLIMERSEWLPLSILAVLMSGASYVPLDPKGPQRRNRDIIAQARCALLLTHGQDVRELETDGSIPNISAEKLAQKARTGLLPRVTPDMEAYTIFTSGSTGQPKGVMVTHANVSSFSHNLTERFGMSADDTLYASTTATFDISVLELVCSLFCGMTVIVGKDAKEQHPKQTAHEIAAKGATVLQLTPTHLRALWDCDDFSLLKNLRVMLVGGEPYPAELDRLSSCLSETAIFNVYGPTETTIWSTAKRIGPGPVTVGTPLIDESVRILAGGELAPVGVWGEICIAGAGVSSGYLGLRELTSKLFVEDPGNPGARMYKTGDLGRFLPSGEIEIRGRSDGQVKVRGFRVELAEVAKALRGVRKIRDAAVVTTTAGGDTELVGYYTSEEALSSESLREQLAQSLPHYMIPTRWRRLERLPVTDSGKLDLRAIGREQESAAPPRDSSAQAPRTELESQILDIFKEVLGVERLGIEDNFFDFGGHSIRAMRIVSRIHKVAKTQVSLADFYRTPTAAGLGRLIETTRKPDPEAASPIPRAEKMPDYPLLPQQRRLWALGQMVGDAPAYVVYAVQRFKGKMDTAILRRALGVLCERHEALRTHLVRRGADVRQKLAARVEPPLEPLDLRGCAAPMETAAAAVRACLVEPFDLEKAPLWRVKIIELPDGECLFLWAAHHIVGDGESMDVLCAQLAALYEAGLTSGQMSLPPQALSYTDYCAWQDGATTSKSQRKYWIDRFTPAPEPLRLPTDFPFGADRRFEGKTQRFELDAEAAARLSKMAAEQRTTVFSSLVTLVDVLLYRYTGQTDITVGVPCNLRSRPELEGMVGFLTSALPIRNHIDPGAGFADSARGVLDSLNEALDRADYPLDDLIDSLDISRDGSRSPLFEVLVSLRERKPQALTMPGLAPLEFALDAHKAKFPLVFEFERLGEKITGTITYATHLFKRQTIERLVGHFQTLTRSAVDRPFVPIQGLNLLPSWEREAVLSGFQPSAATPPKDTLVSLFEKQVKASPNRLAVEFDGKTLTYKEVNDRANGLARALLATGLVRPQAPVGVALKRSDGAVVALLAVMKAGGAYLPIDPTQPEARIRKILDASDAKVLIGPPDLDVGKDVVRLQETAASLDTSDPDVAVAPESAAYIIFTSGSTGTPKGVVVEHGQIVSMIAQQIKALGIDKEDRVLQFASLGFDASISETFMALLCGAALLPATREQVSDVKELAHFAAENAVTVATFPPSYLRLIKDRLWKSLRVVISAGEPGDPDVLRSLCATITCFNAYGPTEASVCATMHRVEPFESYPGFTPIGAPLPGVRVYILDVDRAPTPIGVPGEIYIAGPTVARGYLRDEKQTEGAFFDDPFCPGQRMYKTGDEGCRLDDGLIRIFGRTDDQIKLRGHRIEPQEVRAAMISFEGCADAVVIPANREHADALVGYYLSDAPLDPRALRRHLATLIPEYMVPSQFVHLETLPKTSSGKVDRAALPPPLEQLEPSDAETRAPRNETENRISAAWSEVLGKEGIRCDASFFEVGGNSLRAVKLSFLLEEMFEVELSVADLFTHPTVSDQATLIDSKMTIKLIN